MESNSAVVKAQIEATLPYVEKNIIPSIPLTFASTDFPASLLQYDKKTSGKVRDIYYLPSKVVLVSTDRQSAFDRIIGKVPFKGQVLNLTSKWWFEQAEKDLGISNAVIAVPDPNVTIATKCEPFPIEFVMRGFLTGSTATSIWVNYSNGMRSYCGHALPDGLVKNQKLPMGNILTPTTKDDRGDELTNREEILAKGWMAQADYDACADMAARLFEYGQTVAAKRGLILVDTKYEFGRSPEGKIVLIDEVHTPDSSRYWIADTYPARMTDGKSPENIDKELLRQWVKDKCSDPYTQPIPDAPADVVAELSRRYVMLYEMITGEKFVFPDPPADVGKRVEANVCKFFQ